VTPDVGEEGGWPCGAAARSHDDVTRRTKGLDVARAAGVLLMQTHAHRFLFTFAAGSWLLPLG